MKSLVIETSERLFSPGHCHAQIAGRPDIWADGKSQDEAIGNLVRFHPEIFHVKIDYLGTQGR
jgi:hypothetical protein